MLGRTSKGYPIFQHLGVMGDSGKGALASWIEPEVLFCGKTARFHRLTSRSRPVGMIDRK